MGKRSCCTAVLWFLLFFLLEQALLAATATFGLLKQTGWPNTQLPLKIQYYKSVFKPSFPAGKREGLGKTSRSWVQQQHNAAHAKFVTEGAYHANLSTFIYSTVTFNYKGHAHGCINLHDPGGRRLTVRYTAQMQSKDQPLPQSTHIPGKQGDWRWGKMSRQKNNSRSQGYIEKPDFCMQSCWIRTSALLKYLLSDTLNPQLSWLGAEPLQIAASKQRSHHPKTSWTKSRSFCQALM